MHDSGGINTALQPEKHKIYMKKHAVYGIICTEKAATLDFSGVAAIFVTN